MRNIFIIIFWTLAFFANAGNIIIYQINEEIAFQATVTVTWNGGANVQVLDPTEEETTINVLNDVTISVTGADVDDQIGMEFEDTGAFAFNFQAPSDGLIYTTTLPSNFDTCPLLDDVKCDSDGDPSTVGDAFNDNCECFVPCPTPENLFMLTKTLTSVEFDWDNSLNSFEYNLQIREVGDIDWIDNFTNSSNLTLTNLTQGGSYEARVGSNCGSTNDSGFSGVVSTGVLPVELVYFKAKRQDEKIIINWQTANEINNEGFEIQRSQNGLDFEKIGWVDGFGNSFEQNNYQFIDEEKTIGLTHYRLKQIDFDGQFELSNIIIIDAEFNRELGYPNPANDLFFSKNRGFLRDRLGQRYELAEGENDISNLPEGMYFFNNQKIIIQR